MLKGLLEVSLVDAIKLCDEILALENEKRKDAERDYIERYQKRGYKPSLFKKTLKFNTYEEAKAHFEYRVENGLFEYWDYPTFKYTSYVEDYAIELKEAINILYNKNSIFVNSEVLSKFNKRIAKQNGK